MSYMLNEDNGHFFGSRGENGRKITREDIVNWVKQYADSKIDTLFISPNSMKTSYRSDVWDSVWDEIEGSEIPINNSGVESTKQLYEDGIDIYEVMTETCKEKGIKCFLSMRMNDTHEVSNENSFMHSKFWKEHHDYWRVQHIFRGNFDRAFDYSIKEVREYHFSFVKELFERYDFNGFELDWMRFPMHLRQGCEIEGQQHITEFMRKVRKLADEYEKIRGHKIKISARIPTRPRTAFENGMDFMTWVREGLVDLLVPSPFFVTIDNDIPIELWKSILKDTNVEIAAGLEVLLYISGSKRLFNTVDTAKGSMISYLHRGINHIYLFNYMDSITGEAETHDKLIASDISIEALNKESRRHVITNVDVTVPGAADERILPKTFGGMNTFRVNIGPVPPKDKKAYLILGTKQDELSKEAKVYFNAEIIKQDNSEMPGFDIASNPQVFPIDSKLLKAGYNIIDIDAKGEIDLIWVEIYIK